MRDFTLGACSSDRLMKPTTISTSCRSGPSLAAAREVGRHAARSTGRQGIGTAAGAKLAA